MTKKRKFFSSKQRYHIYAAVTGDEQAAVKRQAAKERLSLSNFMRRCINSYLLELGDDIELLEEYHSRGRTPRLPSLGHSGRRPEAERWPKGSL